MAKLNQNKVSTAILGIVLIIILFKSYAVIVPEAQGAGDEMGDASICAGAGGVWNTTALDCYNQTGNPAAATAVDYTSVPLSGIFSSSGVIFLIVMAALIFIVIKSFTSDMKK